MRSFRQKLVSRIFAISLFLTPYAAFADEQSHPIPWIDLAANDCSVVIEPGQDAAIIVLRCKGHVDVVVDVVSERGK